LQEEKRVKELSNRF